MLDRGDANDGIENAFMLPILDPCHDRRQIAVFERIRSGINRRYLVSEGGERNGNSSSPSHRHRARRPHWSLSEFGERHRGFRPSLVYGAHEDIAVPVANQDRRIEEEPPLR